MTDGDTQPLLGAPHPNSAPLSETTPNLEKKSCFRKFLTIEPVLTVYFLYYTCIIQLSQQYIFARLAETYNFSESIADGSICQVNQSESTIQEIKQIQEKSSYYSLVITSTSLLPAIFTTLLLGSYSDTRGRKPTILIPLAGALARCAGYMIVIGFRLSLWYLVIGSVIEGISGSATSLLMSCFSYIGDVTTHKTRSFRVVIGECAINVSSVASLIVLGYVIQGFGYMYPFIFLFGSTLLIAAYVHFLLPETVKNDNPQRKILEIEHYRRVFRLFTTDDGTDRRWKMQLCILIMFVTGLPLLGQSDSIAYFLKGEPLCFTSEQLGLFNAGFFTSHSIGSLLAVHFLGGHVGDDGLMIMASISGMAYTVLLAFTQSIWMLSLVVISSMIGVLIIALIRSFLSKLAHSDEQGAVFASIACIESLCGTLGVAMLNTVYSASLHILPGFVFLVMAAMFFLGIVFSSVLFIRNTRRPNAELASVQ